MSRRKNVLMCSGINLREIKVKQDSVVLEKGLRDLLLENYSSILDISHLYHHGGSSSWSRRFVCGVAAPSFAFRPAVFLMDRSAPLPNFVAGLSIAGESENARTRVSMQVGERSVGKQSLGARRNASSNH